MLENILGWISNAKIEGMKQYIPVDAAKATTKDLSFEKAQINASSVRACSSFTAYNGFLEFENHVIVLLSI